MTITAYEKIEKILKKLDYDEWETFWKELDLNERYAAEFLGVTETEIKQWRQTISGE